MMRSANPALNKNTFAKVQSVPGTETMTLQGTVTKTGLLLLIIVLSGSFTWMRFFDSESPGDVFPWIIGGAIGGLLFAIITIFKPAWAGVTAPIYAGLEGLFLGGISAIFESYYPGIVTQAVLLTFGILFSLLLAY